MLENVSMFQIIAGILFPSYLLLRAMLLGLTGIKLPGLPVFMSDGVKKVVVFVTGVAVGYFLPVMGSIWILGAVFATIINIVTNGRFVSGFELYGSFFDGLSPIQKARKREIQNILN